MDPIFLALVLGGAAAITVTLEHKLLPEWEPRGYTVLYTYFLGTATLLVYFWLWALLVGAIESAAAFTVIAFVASLGTQGAYARRYLRGRATRDLLAAPEERDGPHTE